VATADSTAWIVGSYVTETTSQYQTLSAQHRVVLAEHGGGRLPGEYRSPTAARQVPPRPPTPPKSRSRKRLNGRHIAAVVAAAATIGGLPASASASPESTEKHPRDVTVLCGKDAHLVTKTGVDVRNNNNFQGEPEC
jgi:hypothetical protein